MGPCIVSIFQYISNKMQLYTVYLYLETALHVSGGTSTHHQERIQLSTASGICHTVTAICRYRGRVRTGLSVLWVAWICIGILLGAQPILHISRIRVNERRGYSHLKEEALNRTMWRARFGRGVGHVVTQTTI